MCLLLLIFVVPMLFLFATPFVALIFAVNELTKRGIKKKVGEGEQVDSAEVQRRITNQIVLIAFGMLVVFLSYLTVRYCLT